MRISILADSNALPRPTEWGGLLLEDTYPYLLERELRRSLPASEELVVTERGMRYRTIESVLNDWYEVVDLRKADVVIVQVGGADCAPRILLPREREWLKKVPFFGKLILKLEEKYRRGWLLRFPARVCVPVEKYRARLREVVARAKQSNSQLIFVNIFEPSPQVLDQFVGAEAYIQRYNSVLSEVSRTENIPVIDLHSLVDSIGGAGKHTVDGLHLDPKGQITLTQALTNEILSLKGVSHLLA